MDQHLYPLRFEPIDQYRLWGGRRLAHLLKAPLPDGPIGEAWILSDRADHPSRVSNGPLKGQTIAQLLEQFPDQVIEDRGSQITFSALGQQAPLEEKKKWDPDFTKRKKIKAILDPLIPAFSVRMGGATSIDVTKPGIDKAYGIGKLRDVLDISLKEMIFVGDALFLGGNDYPAEQAGVVSIPVRGPHETKRVVEAIIACLLFPRLVAKGNYSRIGIARVRFNTAGDPVGVERLGIALEPEAEYELRPNGGGGCEDPRITSEELAQNGARRETVPDWFGGARRTLCAFVEPLRRYVMTYAAFSARGPRIALAVSEDLFHWKRIGLARFAAYQGIPFDDVDDKDSSLFPVAIPNPSGQPEMAMLHRPLFPGTRPEEAVDAPRFGKFTSHERLATPVSPWERLKIGAGTPPVLIRHGWLIVYHGVSEIGDDPDNTAHHLRSSAGVMVVSKEHPQLIRYRSADPVLTPSLPQERDGTVANVVFPTGIDRRDDLGSPDRFDVYYGMADNRIGVARLDLPDCLPAAGFADSPEAKV